MLRKVFNTLQTDWVQLIMVEKDVEFHGPPFKGFCGVAQGDPLSPKLFNIIMDSVMRHWLTVVSEEESGSEVLGRSMQRLVAYFYANNSLMMRMHAGRLKQDFDALVTSFTMSS